MQHQQDHLHNPSQPYKSESMGLLDAEGYKFLEASDSNSEGRDLDEMGDHEMDEDDEAEM